MAYVDKTLVCAKCKGEFVFSSGEQQFFAEKSFKNPPKRCKSCAVHSINPPHLRVQTKVVCGQCGAETTVPFEPKKGTPVLCRTCFKSAGV